MLDGYRRFRWLTLGAIAKVACDYDGTSDAVLMPVVTAALGAICWFAVAQALAVGTLWAYGLAAIATPIAGLVTVLTVFSIGASIVYATQATELPANEEVVTRE
jgi:hypothetical protein